MGRRRTKTVQPTPFGEKILSLRLSKGLSKELIGQRAGVSTTYVSLLENGERQPSREVVQKFALALFPEGNALMCDELLTLAGYVPRLGPAPMRQQDLSAIYEQAWLESPQDFQAFSAWLLSLLKQDRHEEAQKLMQQGFQTFHEHIQLQSLLAMLELSKGRIEDAIGSQRLALEQFCAAAEPNPPIEANLRLNLGTMLFLRACQQGGSEPAAAVHSFAAAREQLQQASALAPEDVYILDEYARVCFNQAQILPEAAAQDAWTDTIAAFQAVLDTDHKAQLGLPMLKEASLFLALAYAKAGQPEQARLCLRLLGLFCAQDWLFHYVSACCLCLGPLADPAPALHHLAYALQDPDPHNRSREAPDDPDLAPLHSLPAFRELFQA